MQTPTFLTEDGCVAPVSVVGGFGAEAPPARRLEFEDVLSHHLPRFLQMAMRHLRNTEDAEDAVQDAFLSAFKNLGRFEGRAQMSSWIMAIVINSARIHLRRHRSCRQMPSIDPDTPDRILALRSEYGNIAEQVADPTPTAEQSLASHELRELILNLAQNLPLCQRTALQLRFTQGLSLKEAAEALGVREGTLKAYVFRGKRKLGRLLYKAITMPGAPAGTALSKARQNASRDDSRSRTLRSLQGAATA
jgi:RNA polymerase sigma-70 factor (ECF subfamily)